MRSLLIALLGLAVLPQSVARFEPVQPDLFAAGGALVNAWADYDGDGDLDLFVGFNATANRLYRNDSGRFSDVVAISGMADTRSTRAAAWGDYDADGDADIAIGLAPGGGHVVRLLRNSGGRFDAITQMAGLAADSGAVRQLAWVDFDADGDLDLFVAFRDRPNALLRNDAGYFRDVARDIGLADTRRTVGAVWFDYDEDGDLDLYVGNMDGDANGLFRNQGGRFTDVAHEADIAWGGHSPLAAAFGTVRPCTGDIDGDGRLDLITANYGNNGLFLNRGNGRFTDASAQWRINVDGRHDTCALGDYDNDGRLDVYINGTVTGGVSYRDHLFRNTGTQLSNVTPPNLLALQASHGAQWVDFESDGDIDLSLAGTRADMPHIVMRNMLSATDAARSLSVRVLDMRGRATRAGAEVRLFAAGTRRLLGARIVDSGSGYNAQNDVPLHFGLPRMQNVDVEVIVPARGRRIATRVSGVDPREYAGRTLLVRARD
jgi:hypothetical protein